MYDWEVHVACGNFVNVYAVERVRLVADVILYATVGALAVVDGSGSGQCSP